jgi:hypothetical protein
MRVGTVVPEPPMLGNGSAREEHEQRGKRPWDTPRSPARRPLMDLRLVQRICGSGSAVQA